MSSNRVDPVKSNRSSTSISVEECEQTWEDIVDEEVKAEKLISITCHAHSTAEKGIADETTLCPCGRLVRSHSFDGAVKIQQPNAVFSGKFVTKQNLTVRGQLNNEVKARVCSIFKIRYFNYEGFFLLL